jgi:flagellar hook-associated protein 3 FlgL
MIGTRITQQMLNQSALNGLQSNLSRNQKLQEQLSSGKLVSRPSDDPAAATNSMLLRSQQRLDDQYLRNIDDAAGRLNTADSALQDISAQLLRAKELIVNAADEALPDSSRSAITSELAVIKKGIIDSYNTKWLGRPVFGGTAQGSVAIDDTGAYVGNDQPTVARIAREVTIRTDVSGTDSGAATLPGLLDQITASITNGTSDFPDLQDQLDSTLNTLLTTNGEVGARAAQVASTQTRVNGEQLDLTARISQNEDVDLPKAILDLQSSQVAYQAALGAAGKVLQVSLLDYLR